MMRNLKLPLTARFSNDESGAVTVDWVVLTAAVTLFGLGAGVIVTGSIPGLATKISTYIAAQNP
jgi:Flp pilus assembly pilin Flp